MFLSPPGVHSNFVKVSNEQRFYGCSTLPGFLMSDIMEKGTILLKDTCKYKQ